MSEQRYRELLANFSNVRVLAVGDIYLDEMTEGAVTEISLEAPIPVFEVHRRKHNPGAAGNAACNAASLGAQVYMVGVIGDDPNGGVVRREFEIRGVDTTYLVVDPARPTSTYGKMRAGGHNIPTQEVLRMDTPRPKPLAGVVEQQVCDNIRALAPQVDAIMIGDQVSACITPAVLRTIQDCAKEHKLVTLADSRDRIAMYEGIDVVKPNDKEAGKGAGLEVVDVETMHAAGRKLLGVAKNVFITRGPKGITVFSQDGSIEDVPTIPCKAVDVTGAGDTVAAATVLTLASGGSLAEAAFLGNMAASVAVGKEGAVTVTRDEVDQVLFGEQGPSKVKRLAELKQIVQQLQAEGKRVVWTNGCFDILHVGHITYLIQARAQGDALVVGLNTDLSVQENKGPNRPVINERDRALVLSALEVVDYVILFDEKTPMRYLEELKPNVYAKGGDYTIETIVQEERRLVEGYGGDIAIIPGVEGHSTTNIIDKILQEAQ
jgi:D-beta-D-heptose 7-phosphate kinase/D-beta-D-heptose 1-phosphate adenosyltransferase